ncbi:MAG: pilus assembly protein [Actinomycetota bacterium]|nr:pilus assembly protein [Actinomycetota bacterium]
MPPRDDEWGTVTAEAAVVMPILLLFTIGMAWLVSLGVLHVRAVDAAREAARTVARGEPTAHGTSVGRRVAGAGSSVHVERRGGLVLVTVTAPVRGPGGLFGFVHRFDMHAQAVAVLEPES